MFALDPAVSAIVALAVALLFAAAALHKLAEWRRFRLALDGFGLVPSWLGPAVAPFLVALECAAAVLLPPAATRPAGAILASALLACYALAIGINLLRGRTSIDCGCLGAGHRHRIGGWMVIRNSGLAAVVLVATLPTTGRGLASLDFLTIAGAVIGLATLYAASDALQRNALVRSMR